MQHLYTAIAKHPECHSVELKDIDECELEDLLHPGIVTMICSVLIDDWKTLSNLSICIKQSIERFDEVMCDLGICQYGLQSPLGLNHLGGPTQQHLIDKSYMCAGMVCYAGECNAYQK